MQKLTLVFSDIFNNYVLTKKINQPIGFLKLFLNDVSNIKSFIQWAVNSEEQTTGTNSTWLEKSNNYILIGSLYSDEPNGGPYFKIPIPEFSKLLTEWEKLVQVKAQTITITEQDGIITIEGG